MSNKLGYLVLWSIPDLSAPYAGLESLAQGAGFDLRYAPTPPNPRHAWEKATNLGKGVKIDPSPALAIQVKAKYGVGPIVKLTHRVINASAPRLVRHIVREVTVFAQDETNPERRAAKQLNVKTVAIITYDCDSKQMTSISDSVTGEKVFDPEGWVNGDINKVVDDLCKEADQAMHNADGQAVRSGIRDFMDSLHGTLLTNGGGYFVPASVADVEKKLDAFQQYIKGLVQYQANNNRLTCNVYAVTDSGDVFDLRNRADIAQSAIGEFRGRIQALVDKVQPVLKGAARGRVADRVSEQANDEYQAIKDGVLAYGQALGDDFVEALAHEALVELLTIKQDYKGYREAVMDDLSFIEDMITIAQNKVMDVQ